MFAFHFEPYCTGIRRDDRTDLTTKSDIFSRKETVTSITHLATTGGTAGAGAAAAEIG